MSSGCFVYPDSNVQPVSIVQSNSHGYSQLPLEEGKYVYIVKTEYGYYIGLYVSSHQPGRFNVLPSEVTELLIYRQPCIWY